MAFVALTVSVAEPPALIEVGLAVMVAAGAGNSEFAWTAPHPLMNPDTGARSNNKNNARPARLRKYACFKLSLLLKVELKLLPVRTREEQYNFLVAIFVNSLICKRCLIAEG